MQARETSLIRKAKNSSKLACHAKPNFRLLLSKYRTGTSQWPKSNNQTQIFRTRLAQVEKVMLETVELVLTCKLYGSLLLCVRIYIQVFSHNYRFGPAYHKLNHQENPHCAGCVLDRRARPLDSGLNFPFELRVSFTQTHFDIAQSAL